MAKTAPRDRPAPSTSTVLGLAVTAMILAGAHCAVHEQPTSSSFELQGAHADVTCSACHVDGFEADVPRTCTGCHEDDRPAPHWQDTCNECHGQEHWDDLEFDHDEYALTGAHAEAECSGCHQDEDEWGEPSKICSACHEDDRPDGHITTDCSLCHSTENWEQPSWTHGFFPLEGGHDGVQCTDCHTTGFHDTPDECHDCHADDAPPGHPGSGCDHCHNIYGW